MRHIRQRNDVDCGLATAAMVCGVSWQRSLDVDNNPDSTSGLTTREFLTLCARLGVSLRMRRGTNRRWLRNEPMPDGVCAAMVRRNLDDDGHYVAIHDGMVWDPGCVAPVPLAAYRRRPWKVARWFIGHPSCDRGRRRTSDR